jgi:MoaA/NifB/PqqE/SkfB family radical SAM enzyme
MKQGHFFNTSLLMAIFDAFKHWGQFRPKRTFVLARHGIRFLKANRTRDAIYKKEGILVPPIIILSVTMQCNLSCKGCYSRDYPRKNELRLDEIDALFREAKSMGTMFFVITGGEPLMREGLLDLCAKHSDIIFMFYTNGAYITPEITKKIAASNNIIPFISIEGAKEATDGRRGKGAYDNAVKAMKALRETKTLFGFSTMVDQNNVALVSSESFFDDLIDRGCRIGLCVGFVPSADSADRKLLLSAEQQADFRKTICRIRKKKRLVLLHMPDDEYEQGGSCMAAGRGFVHINAQGFVEPCPFSHIATDSVASVSLKKALASPLFSSIRDHASLLTKPLEGCALFEHRDELSEIISKTGAQSTEKAAHT